jgi:hypothetical protein
MIDKQGHDKLWSWFSISYSSWLTLPRVLMHEMPDEWQSKMADLMKEWDEHWDFSTIPFDTSVQLKENGKYVSTPEWLSNYRHPRKKDIAILKKASEK